MNSGVEPTISPVYENSISQKPKSVNGQKIVTKGAKLAKI